MLHHAQVEGKIVSEIGQGLVCFIGVEQNDTDADAEYMYERMWVYGVARHHPTPTTLPHTVHARS